MSCDVCNDEGTYPIIDRFGTTRYEIKCPECFGISEAELNEKAARDSRTLADWKAGRPVTT